LVTLPALRNRKSIADGENVVGDEPAESFSGPDKQSNYHLFLTGIELTSPSIIPSVLFNQARGSLLLVPSYLDDSGTVRDQLLPPFKLDTASCDPYGCGKKRRKNGIRIFSRDTVREPFEHASGSACTDRAANGCADGRERLYREI
jgi:hypothetical protein